MTVGQRIRARREELGLTQSELAEKMGYSGKSSVSEAEKCGDNITTTKVRKFADALGVSFRYLMGLEDENGDITPQGQLVDIYADRIKQEKANALYDQYMSLPPEKQAQFDNFLKFLQSDSELPHLH